MTIKTQPRGDKSGGSTMIALNATTCNERFETIFEGMCRYKLKFADLVAGKRGAGHIIALDPNSLTPPPALTGTRHEL